MSSIFVGVMPLLKLTILEIHTSALFSYMLGTEILQIWLCLSVQQIKYDCRQFASIFVGVMPLLELRIQKIHTFPHFPRACFAILSWNFVYEFVWLNFRSSSSVVNMRQFYTPIFRRYILWFWCLPVRVPVHQSQFSFPVRTPEVKDKNMSSVSPACH